MPTDPTAHRDAQRRYRERLASAAAPGTADLQRALALAVKSACARFVNTGYEPLLSWIVRDAARRLTDAGFNAQEVPVRLKRALSPEVLTQIEGECVRVPDADDEHDAEASAPAMGM